MNAFGEHILVKLPPRKEVSDGGLLLPGDAGQPLTYGLVISMGPGVPNTMQVLLENNPIVVYDHLGSRAIVLDPVADEGVVCIHHSFIYCTMKPLDLIKRKLPVPEVEAKVA